MEYDRIRLAVQVMEPVECMPECMKQEKGRYVICIGNIKDKTSCILGS